MRIINKFMWSRNFIKRIFYLTLLLGFVGNTALKAQELLKSPSDFLGYDLGSHFTPQYRIYDYYRYVANQTPRVSIQQYGKTYEGRPLILATIATPENRKHLDEIRTNNLKRAGLLKGTPTSRKIALVWLSYNVHGDEAVSSEAAMLTLYELARPDNGEARSWLEHTIVFMDPMLNPDGRERYVEWYRHTVGARFNPEKDAREHHQPWPGGRVNHYYFDLNRDWAWQVQKETQQRIKIFQKWMPHVHVDFHEMGYTEPYYFAPAAEPFHRAITGWQRDFQVTIGKNLAGYFNNHNWLYFTRQIFDLFYPSYGDTYPLFNGAIGMTYEQGGGGMAGLGIIKPEGDTLTLKDRITHHVATGLTTVKTVAEHYEEIIDQFSDYYTKSATQPGGHYKSYIIKGTNNHDKLRALLNYLDSQQIRYGYAPGNDSYRAFDYQSNTTHRVTVQKNDIIVSAYQPKSVLTRVMFDPKPVMDDSVTYDITAWQLPYRYGLQSYAVEQEIQPDYHRPVDYDHNDAGIVGQSGEPPYAYLAEWKSMDDLQFLSALLNKDVNVRFASQPFKLNGQTYDRGTLVITRSTNTDRIEDFDKKIAVAADQYGQTVVAVPTGFVSDGVDLGSNDIHYMKAPKVALLSGPSLDANAVGEVWHFFEQQIHYPLTVLNADRLSNTDLHDFDVLILPDGSYATILSHAQLAELRDWMKDGGKLIAMERAVSFLAGKSGFDIERSKPGEDKAETAKSHASELLKYANRSLYSISGNNPGSIFRVSMDNTHPLGYGYADDYYTLKLGTNSYQYLAGDWNVGVIKGQASDAHRSGFIGYKAQQALDQSLVFGVQDVGRGEVIYMVDNPLFRGFWYNGKLLFGNAVFMVGQ